MAPIRTAIIGLSSSAATSWASSAHLPYLLSPSGSSKYTIVALLNSSQSAARAAITHYNLPPSTRAYGNPQDLANDRDIDLVVCCTRVDVHPPTILPSVKAGKTVYVEWPLAQDDEHVGQLVEAGRESGSESIVGLQGWLAPPIVRLQDLIREGKIGTVLSSEVRGFGGSLDRETLASGLKYFTDRAVGGNIYTIGFGHLFDQVQHVLGDLHSIKSHLRLQRPAVKLRDSSNQITETVQSNVPDLFLVAGSVSASSNIQENAAVHVRFRRGQPFKDTPALEWTINGTKGEIRLVAQEGTTLHASAYTGPVTIEVHDFESDEVERVVWKWEDWQEELPIVARSVGAVYEKFAESGTKGLASFEHAQGRHLQLNEILAGWNGGN